MIDPVLRNTGLFHDYIKNEHDNDNETKGMTYLSTTDSFEPYNDAYSIFNQFDRILFRPSRPLMQSELNELQSAQQDQQRLLARWSMNNGSIISGMNFRNEGHKDSNDVPDDTNPNLFAWRGLAPSNARVSPSSVYVAHGEINVDSEATNSNQYPELSITYNVPKGQQYATVSFDLAEMGSNAGGRLENIGLSVANGATVQEATVDGQVLKNGELTNDSGYNLTDTKNDLVDLTDGNFHQVIITFNISQVGSDTTSFNLFFNYGYDAVEESCDVKLDHFKVEQGKGVTAWELNSGDENDPSASERTLTASISGGFVYLDGYVRHFDPQEINIKGDGNEKIGLRLVREAYTSDDDHELVDKTQGTLSFGSPGADREHYDMYLTYGDEPTDAIIYYLHDGHIVANANYNRTQQLNDHLAQRTYETNGSYLVSGMDMSAHPDKLDSDKVDIQFSPGIAYVLGHRITNDGSDELPIDTETSATAVPDEVQTVHVDSATGQYHLIKPNLQPIMLERQDLGGNKSEGGISITGEVIPTGNGWETPVEFPTSSISNFADSDGDETVLFDPNNPNDYVIAPTENNQAVKIRPDSFTIYDNAIHWGSQIYDINGNSVDLKQGGTAYVVCPVSQQLYGPNEEYYTFDDKNSTSADSDTMNYHLVTDGSGTVYIDLNQDVGSGLSDIAPADNGREWSPEKLLDGSEITLHYWAYNSRDDVVTLSSNGTFHAIKGQPALADRVAEPYLSDDLRNRTLQIGYVHVAPNQQSASAIKSTTPRIPFSGLDQLALAVHSLQDNMSLLAAREASMAGTDPSTLLDTFADYFITTDKADEGDLDAFDIAFNPAEYITPSFLAEGNTALTSSDTQATNVLGRDSITGTATTQGAYTFTQQTTNNYSLQLNDFGHFTLQGIITCDPSTFNNTDAMSRIQDPDDVNVLTAEAAASAANTNFDATSDGQVSGGNELMAGYGLNSAQAQQIKSTPNSALNGLMYQNTTNQEVKNARFYMMSQWVHVGGTGFTPNAQHFSIQVLTDGDLNLPVTNGADLDSSNSHIYGQDNPHHYTTNNPVSKNGTVDADSKGNISCWFLIPHDTLPCGRQHIRLSNPLGEYGDTYIDGTLSHTTRYSTTHDVVINDRNLVDYDHTTDANAISSADMTFTSDISSLNASVTGLSGSAAAAVDSLSDFGVYLSGIADSMQGQEAEDAASLGSAITDLSGVVDEDMGVVSEEFSNVYSDMDTIASNASAAASSIATDEQLQSEKEEFDNSFTSSCLTSLQSANDSNFNNLYNDDMDLNSDVYNLQDQVDSQANDIYTNTSNIANDELSIAVNNADESSNAAQFSSYSEYTDSNLASLTGNMFDIQGFDTDAELSIDSLSADADDLASANSETADSNAQANTDQDNAINGLMRGVSRNRYRIRKGARKESRDTISDMSSPKTLLDSFYHNGAGKHPHDKKIVRRIGKKLGHKPHVYIGSGVFKYALNHSKTQGEYFDHSQAHIYNKMGNLDNSMRYHDIFFNNHRIVPAYTYWTKGIYGGKRIGVPALKRRIKGNLRRAHLLDTGRKVNEHAKKHWYFLPGGHKRFTRKHRRRRR